MRNVFLTLTFFVLVAFMATGCDFFRRLAGRPDSEWIEAKAESIRKDEEALRARQDSLEAARKAVADSLAAADSVRQANHRYRFVVILAFRNSTAVGVCGTDDPGKAQESLKELQRQDFCPKGAWILERKQ